MIFLPFWSLMLCHHVFNIASYHRDPQTLQAHLYYDLDDQIHFHEVIHFATHIPAVHEQTEIITSLLAHLHIALGMSYYKLYPYAQIVIHTVALTTSQITFWTDFYRLWLGEYCARNDINPLGIGHIQISQNAPSPQSTPVFELSDRAIVAMWGGKDSIVSAELLKSIDYEFDLISIGKIYPIHHQVASILGRPLLHITRTLDPLLFELNTQSGYYNGHVPITGMLAWIKIVCAYIYDYRMIIMSNEKSANEGNMIRHGQEVNHQWSKSLQFEQSLKSYLFDLIGDQIQYFSLLRGMYEIEIVKLFARRPQYFTTFSSCNTNFKLLADSPNERRCNHCPKCVFVYTMLRPYIDHDHVMKIWWKELYADQDLIHLYQQLLGIGSHKPRECVGTNQEMTRAMYQTYTNHPQLRQTPVMQMFADTILPSVTPEMTTHLQDTLTHIDDVNMIPSSIWDRLKEMI